MLKFSEFSDGNAINWVYCFVITCCPHINIINYFKEKPENINGGYIAKKGTDGIVFKKLIHAYMVS